VDEYAILSSWKDARHSDTETNLLFRDKYGLKGSVQRIDRVVCFMEKYLGFGHSENKKQMEEEESIPVLCRYSHSWKPVLKKMPMTSIDVEDLLYFVRTQSHGLFDNIHVTVFLVYTSYCYTVSQLHYDDFRMLADKY
jgi:hypothetical protein